MKFLIFTTMCLQILNSYANFTQSALVKVRDEDRDIVSENVLLKELDDQNKLSGKFFTVVDSNTNNPLLINVEDEISRSLRGTTAYYHLTKAKDYFESIGVVQSEPLLVRIGVRNKFHKSVHMMDISHGEVFNNAHTINSGLALKSRYKNVEAWGKEIWFRSPKEIEISDTFKTQYKEAVRSILPNSRPLSKDFIFSNAVNSLISSNPSEYLKGSTKGVLQNYATNMLLRFIIPEVSLFMLPGYKLLDTALIPEIIYHEYTHFVFSDKIPTVENTPILEGISDYFGTKISGSSRVVDNLDDYGSLVKVRDSRSRILYEPRYDSGKKEDLGSGAGFVLAVLTSLEDFISSEEVDPDFFAKAIYNIRNHVNVNSKIQKDLANSLVKVLPNYRRSIISILSNYGL